MILTMINESGVTGRNQQSDYGIFSGARIVRMIQIYLGRLNVLNTTDKASAFIYGNLTTH